MGAAARMGQGWGPVQASLIDFDAESAASFLTENPNLFAEDETVDKRILELQRRVRIEMSAAVSVEVQDREAVHVITYPAAAGTTQKA